MSEAEKHEYMTTVRWKTAGYIGFAVASLLVGGTGGVYMIKADIKGVADNLTTLRQESKSDNRELKHYVDSGFNEIWNVLNNRNLEPSKRVVKVANDGCMIEKNVNGHLVFVPVDCDYNKGK